MQCGKYRTKQNEQTTSNKTLAKLSVFQENYNRIVDARELQYLPGNCSINLQLSAAESARTFQFQQMNAAVGVGDCDRQECCVLADNCRQKTTAQNKYYEKTISVQIYVSLIMRVGTTYLLGMLGFRWRSYGD